MLDAALSRIDEFLDDKAEALERAIEFLEIEGLRQVDI